MGTLKDWASKQSPFIQIGVGESLTAKYKGYKMVANRFDVEKETVRYQLELEDGTEKPWENGQLAVARVFDALEKDVWVKITRTGEGNKTRYEIGVVGNQGPVKVEKVK